MINRLLDVFASFQKHEVKYVVIGGMAAILHGVPRAIFDLDILIEASKDDAWRNRVTMNYQGQDFYVASKSDLISSKKAAGCKVDLEDVRLLTLDRREAQ